ncbi:DUF998 domain-containing protein [Plantactinospora sp. GCM10030261]|uniref:DUF998 domain-containing protein n=1 Tax=Plantactinospora sp. GCM10030261 TaxID=3273420 RepID=UPI0036198326
MPTTSRLSYPLLALSAPILLIGVDVVDAATRPGYEPARHWISHLSLGDRGWLGTAKLAVVGLLILLVAMGLRTASRATSDPVRRGSFLAHRWVAAAGSGLLLAAVFPMDPGLGFPPGATPGQSWRGTLHDLAAGVLFVSLTVAGWRLGRDLHRAHHGTGWRTAGRVVAATVILAFLACTALVSLDYAGTWPGAPSGLLERIAAYTGLAWVGVAASRALRTRREPSAGQPHTP